MYSGAKILIQCIELKSGFRDSLAAVHLLRGPSVIRLCPFLIRFDLKPAASRIKVCGLTLHTGRGIHQALPGFAYAQLSFLNLNHGGTMHWRLISCSPIQLLASESD